MRFREVTRTAWNVPRIENANLERTPDTPRYLWPKSEAKSSFDDHFYSAQNLTIYALQALLDPIYGLLQTIRARNCDIRKQKCHPASQIDRIKGFWAFDDHFSGQGIGQIRARNPALTTTSPARATYECPGSYLESGNFRPGALTKSPRHRRTTML
jgi:hypothetical protein